MPLLGPLTILSVSQHLPFSQSFILVKGMATHYSILTWRIPWSEEPGGLQSIGSKRVQEMTERLTHIPGIDVFPNAATRGRLKADMADGHLGTS